MQPCLTTTDFVNLGFPIVFHNFSLGFPEFWFIFPDRKRSQNTRFFQPGGNTACEAEKGAHSLKNVLFWGSISVLPRQIMQPNSVQDCPNVFDKARHNDAISFVTSRSVSMKSNTKLTLDFWPKTSRSWKEQSSHHTLIRHIFVRCSTGRRGTWNLVPCPDGNKSHEI